MGEINWMQLIVTCMILGPLAYAFGERHGAKDAYEKVGIVEMGLTALCSSEVDDLWKDEQSAEEATHAAREQMPRE